ncbi:hypothetical protein LY78DRAFT_482529 [Colletotrichum sublineola]|uniref:Uncharacterized protein n=1 Tax=Colletotrichum sublineola TaxID=1173701 RepID=A0A066X3Q0_COLSU|nr:hypothetical protein LY78DRAFT_482529 [Colletotrichum sublineola]KDN63743.1 hypothetical protein CSUB01_03206 [Colletotrichum sublineola]
MANFTYILAPNFDYHSDGPIQIGSIIADPFRPAKPLSKVAATPAVATAFQYDLKTDDYNGRGSKLSLWAHILSAISVGAGASRSTNAVKSLTVKRLETRYLAEEPVDDDPEIIRRLEEPRVQATIKGGLFGRAPVYLISGVKIAWGLAVVSETGKAVGGSLTATTPAAKAIGIDVGASMEGGKCRKTTSSFNAGDQDSVVAYQLHIIKTRKPSKDVATVDVFEIDAAFLHDDESHEESASIEITVGGVEALAEAAREMEIEIETEKILRPDGEGPIFVQAKDE